jgi:glycosyltransferase involved in cell wall biosynthesis
MSRGVWMVTTYPLWFDNGYATNVRATVEAVGKTGLAGIVSVLPARMVATQECRDWRSEYARMTGLPIRIVASPPDMGRSALRLLSDAITTSRLAAVLRQMDAKLIHARGLRAGYLVSAPGMPRVLLDIRGDSVAEARLASEARPSSRASRLVRWSVREVAAAIRAAAGFAVVSDAMGEWLLELTGPDGRPVEVIPCPVNVERFEWERHSDRPREIVIAYVGGLQAYQPASMVVDALSAVASAARVPASVWVVTPSQHDEVRDLLDRVGLKGEVERLDHEAVESRLREADIGVVPREENAVNSVSCPTKIGEYLAAGVPVLAGAGVSRWGARLRGQRVGTVLDDSADAGDQMGEFVASVLSERREYARRCRAVAEADWSWKAAAPRLLSLYDRLLDREGGQR